MKANTLLRDLELESDRVHEEFELKISNIRNEYYKELEKIQIRRGEMLADEAFLLLLKPEIDDLDIERPIVNVNGNFNPGTPGWPGFWLNALKNCKSISSLINLNDEPILYFLSNITSPKETEVTFHFSKNPYFTNKKLSLDFESEQAVLINWLEDVEFGFFDIFMANPASEYVTSIVMAIRDCLLITPLDHALNTNDDCSDSQNMDMGSRYPFSMFF